jgi:hypothetical protein
MFVLTLLYLAALLVTFLLGVRFFVAVFSSQSRTAIARHPILHLLLLVFVLFVWFAPWGSALGFVAAKYDASRGVFHLYSAPFRADLKSRIAFSRILRDRYGLFCSPMRGCIVFSYNDILFEHSYDAVMLPAIALHFGRDIVEECRIAAAYETTK